MAARRLNWEELWPQVQELQAAGKTVKEIAAEMEVELSALRARVYREEKATEKAETKTRKAAEINCDLEKAFEQTPTPEPDQAANQKPERGEREPAGDSVTELPPPVKMPIGCELPKGDGFTVADEALIPYTVADEKVVPNAVAMSILGSAWCKVDTVLNDPIALPLIKELIKQGVA